MPYNRDRQRAYNLKTARKYGFATWSEYSAHRRANQNPDRPRVSRTRHATEAERVAARVASRERMARRKGYGSFADYNRAKSKGYQREILAKLREEMFAAYGHACTCCGESNAAFLTLEHGVVAIIRKTNGKRAGSVRQYRQAKLLGWPPSMTVLCMNCNWGKRNGGICPHKVVNHQTTT